MVKNRNIFINHILAYATMGIKKIISGGQTGVDRAGLDAAIEHNIPHGGWCPHGRRAEDGMIDERYRLKETDSHDYSTRTEYNIRDSDGTLILNIGRLEGGTAYTHKVARSLLKPSLIVDISIPVTIEKVIKWLEENNIETLNIAGPRESKHPGIYTRAMTELNGILSSMDDLRSES